MSVAQWWWDAAEVKQVYWDVYFPAYVGNNQGDVTNVAFSLHDLWFAFGTGYREYCKDTGASQPPESPGFRINPAFSRVMTGPRAWFVSYMQHYDRLHGITGRKQ